MASFVVVDLHNQASAVALHVQGCSKDEVLSWLGRFGALKQATFDPDAYLFVAPSGLDAKFVLREDGEFFIISTRRVYRLREGVFFVVGDETLYPLQRLVEDDEATS